MAPAALQFNNTTSDKIVVTDVAALQTMPTFTVAMWVRASSFVNNASLIAKRGGASAGWALSMSGTSGNISFRVNGGTTAIVTTTTTPLSPSRWVCVVGTFLGSGVGIHIQIGDLVTPVVDLISNSSGATQGSDVGTNLIIGNDPAVTTRSFPGDIAYASVWNRVLTAAELIAWQWAPMARLPAGGQLVLFDLGAQGTANALDYSGNKNTGVLTGPILSRAGPLSVPLPRRARYPALAAAAGSLPMALFRRAAA